MQEGYVPPARVTQLNGACNSACVLVFVQNSLEFLYKLASGGCGSIYLGKLADLEQGSKTQIVAKTVLVRVQGLPHSFHPA